MSETTAAQREVMRLEVQLEESTQRRQASRDRLEAAQRQLEIDDQQVQIDAQKLETARAEVRLEALRRSANVPAPSATAPAPTPSAAARPGARTAGLCGPGSVGRNRGLDNLRGRGYSRGRGDRGGGFRPGVNRNQRTDNSANAPRIPTAGSIDRNTSRGPSTLTCASRNPEENTAAALQVMRNTGARRYTSVTRGVPEGVRALAERRQWLRSVMFSDSDEPNRRGVDDRINLDTHESRATDAGGPGVANVDVPQERATADEEEEDRA